MRKPVGTEEYVLAAAKHAVYEQVEPATVAGSISEFPGLLAFGDNKEECERDLHARLEDWVKLSLANGYELPVLDGIDLNSKRSYGARAVRQGSSLGDFYANPEELETAFAKADRALRD